MEPTGQQTGGDGAEPEPRDRPDIRAVWLGVASTINWDQHRACIKNSFTSMFGDEKELNQRMADEEARVKRIRANPPTAQTTQAGRRRGRERCTRLPGRRRIASQR